MVRMLAYSKKSLCLHTGFSLDFLVRTLLLFIGYESLPRSSISDGLPAPAAAAATFGGSSDGGSAGRSMYCGFLLSSWMYGRLIRATRFRT